MYYIKCCVPGCNRLRKDVKLHKFPKNDQLRQKWIKFIDCDSLRVENSSELCKLCVCHKHFEATFVNETSRLLGHAYPTLFSPEEIATGIPSQAIEDENTENASYNEHNYSRKRHYDHTYFKKHTSNLPLRNVTEPVPSMSKASESDLSGGIDQILPSLDPVPSSSKAPESDLLRTPPSLDPVPSTSKAPDSNPPRKNHRTLPSSDTTSAFKKSEPDHSLGLSQTLPSSVTTESSEKIVPQTPKKKKIMQKFDDLTPNCKRLYKEYRKSRKLQNFTRRAKKALQFSKEHSFEELTKKMQPTARTFLWMQIKLCTKKTKGRRFSLEEKLLALAILKQSPKSYKFLRRIFILPSQSTLKQMIAKLNVGPGLNPAIFTSLKQEATSWKEHKKYCTIIFDEMALETGLTYTRKDEINGFVELTERTSNYADHVLVFMIKGAIYKWEQPIAYYFCEGATKAVELKNILKSIVTAVGEAGLIPIALVSDQGTAFQCALKMLQQETRREQILAEQNIDDTVHIGGFKLGVIFDPPHLIKGIRNNFLTKDIVFNGKRARWSDIVDVYNTDCQHAESRLLHKLNDEHVIPEKIKKMKVKNCVRVLSHTMAGALSYTSSFSHYADGRPVSHTLKNTAEVVSFLDDLFDSVNGASVFKKDSKYKTKLLRTAVTASSKHHTFWSNSIKKLETFKYIKNNEEKVVPTIKNWVTTLKTLQRLWQFFVEKDIKIMRPRYFNSDTIENFFGQVRAYNYRCTNPDCHTFTNTFKSLLITRIMKFHSSSYNCEEDPSNVVLKIRSLFKGLGNGVFIEESTVLREIDHLDQTVTQNEARRERLMIHSRAYTAGWVLRKILSRHNCKLCKSDLTVSRVSDVHQWVSHREYQNMRNMMKLTYASEHVIMCFGTILKETNNYLEQNAHRPGVSKEVQKIITIKYSDNMLALTCQEHKTEIMRNFFEISCKLAIFNWCNSINKILKGSDIVRLSSQRNLPLMQEKALKKYRKKLKIKK